MAFSQKAEKELSTWFQPAYTNFIEKPDANAIIPMDSWDVNCYFVPVFSGVLQAAAGKAEKKMKEGLDKGLQQNVLLFKGKADEIKSNSATLAGEVVASKAVAAPKSEEKSAK
jgi:hypothetical protein